MFVLAALTFSLALIGHIQGQHYGQGDASQWSQNSGPERAVSVPIPVRQAMQTPASPESQQQVNWETRDQKAQVSMMWAAWAAVGMTFVGLCLVARTLHYTGEAAKAAHTTLTVAQDTLEVTREAALISSGPIVRVSKVVFGHGIGAPNDDVYEDYAHSVAEKYESTKRMREYRDKIAKAAPKTDYAGRNIGVYLEVENIGKGVAYEVMYLCDAYITNDDLFGFGEEITEIRKWRGRALKGKKPEEVTHEDIFKLEITSTLYPSEVIDKIAVGVSGMEWHQFIDGQLKPNHPSYDKKWIIVVGMISYRNDLTLKGEPRIVRFKYIGRVSDVRENTEIEMQRMYGDRRQDY